MLSLIIPVYRNEASLPDLLTALNKLNDEINDEINGSFEVVFVIDGSPDRCYEVLRNTLPDQSFPSQLILLSRNFGSFPAIRAGLEAAKGNRFSVMAADLQEPPELVFEMNKILQKSDVDIVVAVREGRDDPLLSRILSTIFWGFYRRFVVSDMPSGGVDIFACNLIFRNQLLKLEERHSSLIAQVFWLGFRRELIGYKRKKRQQGKSAWTLNKKINYLMDSVFSFTDLPIRLLTRVGGVATLLSGVLGLVVIIARTMGLIAVPGYTTIIAAIVFFGSLNLFALGIIGSYAWRTYENTKARPLHVILTQTNFLPKAQSNDN